jgi:hypothetical protein
MPYNEKQLDMLPIRPGAEFFKVFVEHSHVLKSAQSWGKQFFINIPITVGLYDNRFLMWTNPNGAIECSFIFKEDDVWEEITTIAKEVYKKEISEDLPAMVFKGLGQLEPLSFSTFYHDIWSNKIDVNTIAQQFIYPFGGKACCVRYVYYNSNWNIEGKTSYSMNIANKLKIDDKMNNKKYDIRRR